MNLLFDFDGTLVDQHREKAFMALVKNYATNRADQLASKQLVSELWRKDIWLCSHEIYDRTVLFRLFRGHFEDNDPEELCREFWQAMQNTQRPLSGSSKVLACLAKDHHLFCATDTDGPRSNKASRIQVSGLGKFFQKVFIGSENGMARKGTAKYIKEILRGIGAETAQCVMIGDKVRSDLLPAHNVGLPTVLMRNPEFPGGWPIQTKTLQELIPVVADIANGKLPPRSEFDRYVGELEEQRRARIDNESRELMAVHHTGFIVAEAGQIYRGFTNSDHGIDGEIEFKDHQGRASGKRLYVQLKSGDSYLKKRERDGAEVFQIKNARWADYWHQQAYAVMLVIRTSDGEIRWMDVSAYLKRESAGGKTVRQIVFAGERLDAVSVQNWRKRLLGLA